LSHARYGFSEAASYGNGILHGNCAPPAACIASLRSISACFRQTGSLKGARVGDDAVNPAIAPTGAVFLSYASQDAEAAGRICSALRAAGIEVWFDRTELRGGDAWDRKIQDQIHECRLFLPVISANTERRDEGYFRREWALAADRTRDMAERKTFLLPVVIDDTPERGASVPDKFRHVQWTRLPGGTTPPEYAAHIAQLLSSPALTVPRVRASPAGSMSTATLAVGAPFLRPKRALLAIAVVIVIAALAYVAVRRPPQQPDSTLAGSPATGVAPSTSFSPPPHSIAVLPFVNMSGDKEQEYFSEGLTEEILNSLARLGTLQVSARTSSFSFKGKDSTIGAIARELNVGAILEGSVRRSERTIRVTAQLNDAVTGFHLWSQTYDRDLSDVLRMQTEIANAVASALKVTLLHDAAAKLELGGTRVPAAFDAYLRASRGYYDASDAKSFQPVLDAYTEAIRLDPGYVIAIADRSLAFDYYAGAYATGQAVRHSYEEAARDARRAVALAPELAQAHLALATSLESALDFADAAVEYQRALARDPNNVRLLRQYGLFAVLMGRSDEGVNTVRRATTLDPLNGTGYTRLGWTLLYARRNEESVAANSRGLLLDPRDYPASVNRGLAYYALGDLQQARSSCEASLDNWYSQACLAITYEGLGRHADAQAKLARLKASMGDAQAYWYAVIYAQWGNPAAALQWLETAQRLHDPALEAMKVDQFMDPLRNQASFQAIERALKFPN
jgi:TolB-like protein/Flp pilus assembly protein TadD